MSALPVVFLGPTLSLTEARDVLDAEYLPPVQLGDVWRITQERPPAIGIVDGYFDRLPAVRHKEILHALSCSVPVYGSASMGALRAAELAAFGMTAIGEIAQGYLSGELTCDDEVALLHADGPLGYCAYSEPLVNIRATVAAARADAVVSERAARAIIETARRLYYPDRVWTEILETVPAAAEEIAAFRRWLPAGRVDQKRADALLMLQRMRSDLARPEADRRSVTPHAFTPTVLWRETVLQETPIDAILEEFLLTDPLSPALKAGLARAQRGGGVDWLSLLQAEPDWPTCCRRARRKQSSSTAASDAASDADALLAWFFGERLGWPEDLDAFLRERSWTDPARVLAVAARESAFSRACARESAGAQPGGVSQAVV